MIRRAFWFTTGAAAGVWATTKVQRKIRSLAPDALALRAADRAVEGGQRLREFALDVRAGMAQREGELKDALGIAPADEADRYRELPAQGAAQRRPAALPRQQGTDAQRSGARSSRKQAPRQLGAVRPAGAARPAERLRHQEGAVRPDRADSDGQQSHPTHPNDRNEDH